MRHLQHTFNKTWIRFHAGPLCFLDPPTKGPMKDPPYICLFIFSTRTLLWNCSQYFFCYFLHEGRLSSNLKRNRARFFEKEYAGAFFSAKRGYNWPKRMFFKFYEKLTVRIFLFFFHIVTVAYKLKIDLYNFCG